jgi:hypothetical protein
MADVDWPTSLPQSFQQDSFMERQQSGVISTEMDTGAKKTRRRFTAVTTYWQGNMIFTESQVIIFKNFFKLSIGYGSLRFNFPNQYDLGSTVEARFRIADTPYSLSPDRDTLDFLISFELEVFEL